jgi:hypothetical protein
LSRTGLPARDIIWLFNGLIENLDSFLRDQRADIFAGSIEYVETCTQRYKRICPLQPNGGRARARQQLIVGLLPRVSKEDVDWKGKVCEKLSYLLDILRTEAAKAEGIAAKAAAAVAAAAAAAAAAVAVAARAKRLQEATWTQKSFLRRWIPQTRSTALDQLVELKRQQDAEAERKQQVALKRKQEEAALVQQ